LDACRQIKRTSHGTDHQQIGLYRDGKLCMFGGLDWGADHTVSESTTTFVKWKEFPDGLQR